MHRLKIRHSRSFSLASLFAMASLGVTACNLLDSSPVSSNESSSSVQSDNTLSSSSVSVPWLNLSSQAVSSSSLTQPTKPYNSSSSTSSSSSNKANSSSSDEIITGEIVSCDMYVDLQMSGASSDIHFCGEMPESSVTEEVSAACTNDASLGLTASLGTSCPTGAVLKCTSTENGATFISYYYNSEYEGMTCEEVNAE